VKLRLRYPAMPGNARNHAELAVKVAREEYDTTLDYSPESLESLDAEIESLREDGLDGEAAAEVLFVFGCYLGEVMVTHLKGSWVPTPRSPLRDLSPWPMVVTLPDGSAWDTIGKVYKRLELGDSEYLPAFFQWAAQGRAGGARG
jgi:hypothetical protein